MPLDDVSDRALQRADVQIAAQPQSERDVVRRRVRVEPVEEPHPLLREREWNSIGTRPRHQRRPRARALLDPRRECRDRRGLEQCPDRDRRVGGGTEPGHHLGGHQRVATEFEEVVVEADPVETEDVGEHLGDHRLDRSRRLPELASPRGRFGQRSSVQLSVGGQRNCVEHHERRRDHVLGELLGHRRTDGVDVDRGTGCGHQVSNKARGTGSVLAHDHRGLSDGRSRQNRRFDFAQFDAEAADLDLIVCAPDEFELAGGRPPGDVAGAIEHGSVACEGICHESCRRQVRPTQVSPCHLTARDVHLSRDTRRHEAESRIQHVHRQPGDRPTHQ